MHFAKTNQATLQITNSYTYHTNCRNVKIFKLSQVHNHVSKMYLDVG